MMSWPEEERVGGHGAVSSSLSPRELGPRLAPFDDELRDRRAGDAEEGDRVDGEVHLDDEALHGVEAREEALVERDDSPPGGGRLAGEEGGARCARLIGEHENRPQRGAPQHLGAARERGARRRTELGGAGWSVVSVLLVAHRFVAELTEVAEADVHSVVADTKERSAQTFGEAPQRRRGPQRVEDERRCVGRRVEPRESRARARLVVRLESLLVDEPRGLFERAGPVEAAPARTCGAVDAAAPVAGLLGGQSADGTRSVRLRSTLTREYGRPDFQSDRRSRSRGHAPSAESALGLRGADVGSSSPTAHRGHESRPDDGGAVHATNVVWAPPPSWDSRKRKFLPRTRVTAAASRRHDTVASSVGAAAAATSVVVLTRAMPVSEEPPQARSNSDHVATRATRRNALMS
mmetsp:Transcript_16177/g.65380  ORF Transcript_16177/g.65380 Transcript_16177/m.65380 type:complete len:407 (+) Transcript_16177:28-1248(+)